MLKKFPKYAKDPTKTLGARNKLIKQIDRRFNKLKRLIKESLIKNENLTINDSLIPKRSFEYLYDTDKLSVFNDWLNLTINDIIFDNVTLYNVKSLSEFWFNEGINYSYTKGVVRQTNVLNLTLSQSGGSFLMPSVFQKAEFLYLRSYNQLRGITNTMSSQISNILSDGILKGLNPNDVADKILDRVDKIGKTRSKLIARTEMINANAQGAIVEGDQISNIIGEKVYYIWTTAQDDRVRNTHKARAGKIYTKDKVLTLIGEPNCRCAITAIPESMLDGRKVIP